MANRWFREPGVIALAIMVASQFPTLFRATSRAAEKESGTMFDAAPFGSTIREPDGTTFGVRWAEPRKIRRVVVEFGPQATLPDPSAVRVQYWQKSWDGRPDPVLAETGACGLGWAAMDDWTNGTWKDADARTQTDGRRWTFTFAPTGEKEFADLGGPGVAYRKTLMLRLAADKALPTVARLQAFTDAANRPLTVRIFWGPPADSRIRLANAEERGAIEVFNGSVAALRSVPSGNLTVGDSLSWSLPTGSNGSVEADILMAADPTDPRYDRTIVTVRSPSRPFSFAADEVARGDRILVDDLGMLVVRGDDPITLDEYRQARKEFPGKTVYDRVSQESEQTLTRAWNDMPLKRALFFVHGLPGNRNAVRQEPNGGIHVTSEPHWFTRPGSPRDTERKKWSGGNLVMRFGFPDDSQRGGRALRDGWLPLLRTWWQDGTLYYEQETVLDALDGDLTEIRADDPTLLLMNIRVVNTSDSAPALARLRITTRDEKEESLSVQGDRIPAAAPDGPHLRALIASQGKGDLAASDGGVNWSLELPPGQSHNLYVFVPSITLTTDDEIAQVRRREFSADAQRICDFWRGRTDGSTRIETPEPWLNDFYRAHLRHLLVNCRGEVDSDRLHAHVGSFHYGDYPNEAVMMISDLDRRGRHDEARRCLDSYLQSQGTVPLPGNFKSSEGLFYGSGGHEMGGYNKSHGYVMWGMAEHWWFTRDRAWMESVAPKLVQACEWVIRERQATMSQSSALRTQNSELSRADRPIEYGFLPAGGLEDVQDYWYWLATNAATVWGFDALSAALADFGHPEAPRLVAEAKAYHDDVMTGLTESRVLSPVVRLRDGTYVPKTPSNLHIRGRSHGWIRETLEGPLFLLYYRLIAPDTPDATWILKDYEDNLYISDRYGYSIPVFDQFWFSRGGFSMQANLLDGPPPYLYRDDIKHYLRTYFNSFASAFYPDIRMCNEHSAPELGYPAGDHFKSSDEAQSTFWLRLMFVREDGRDLYLGQAIPRYWLAQGETIGIEQAASHFGPLSLRITSAADEGRITAVLTPPGRNAPDTIYLRLRHPESKPIQSVTVNGKPYDRFDPKKEWVVLPGTLETTQEVVARY